MPINYVNELLFCVIQSCLLIAQLCFSGKLTTVQTSAMKAEVRYASVMTDKIPEITISRFLWESTHILFVWIMKCCRGRATSKTHRHLISMMHVCASCQVAQEPIGNTDHEVNMLLHTARHFVYDYSPTKILVFGINTRTNNCKHEMF